RHTRSKRDWSSDVCSSDLGWTDGMMRALLPPPRYINPPSAPRGIRVWKKSDVLRAERSPEFGELRARPRRAGGESRDPWKDAKQIGRASCRARAKGAAGAG